MDPSIQEYLEWLNAMLDAYTNATRSLTEKVDALVVSWATSTPAAVHNPPSPTPSLESTTDASAPVPDISGSTTKAQEVLEVIHDAPPACIARAHITCSAECSHQVATTDIVNEVHDATAAIFLEPAFDLNDTTPILPMADASLMSLVTRPAESVPSVALLTLSLPPAVVHQSDALAHVRCSTDYIIHDDDPVQPTAHTEHQLWLPPLQVQFVQVGVILFHGSPHGGFVGYFSSEWWPPDHQPRMKNKFPWMFRKYPFLNTQVHGKGLTSSYFSVNLFHLGDHVYNTWGQWLSLLGHCIRILPGKKWLPEICACSITPALELKHSYLVS